MVTLYTVLNGSIVRISSKTGERQGAQTLQQSRGVAITMFGVTDRDY